MGGGVGACETGVGGIGLIGGSTGWLGEGSLSPGLVGCSTGCSTGWLGEGSLSPGLVWCSTGWLAEGSLSPGIGGGLLSS